VLRYLLDADVCIHVLRRKRPILRDRLIETAGRTALSTITLTELKVGVEKSVASVERREALSAFCAALVVLDFDGDAADHAADIRARLERVGQKIGPIDTLVAGHARSLGATLVTGNTREFSRVPGLLHENWLGPLEGLDE
jgi:tRNA(fMet)-specific endonuclease VapC